MPIGSESVALGVTFACFWILLAGLGVSIVALSRIPGWVQTLLLAMSGLVLLILSFSASRLARFSEPSATSMTVALLVTIALGWWLRRVSRGIDWLALELEGRHPKPEARPGLLVDGLFAVAYTVLLGSIAVYIFPPAWGAGLWLMPVAAGGLDLIENFALYHRIGTRGGPKSARFVAFCAGLKFALLGVFSLAGLTVLGLELGAKHHGLLYLQLTHYFPIGLLLLLLLVMHSPMLRYFGVDRQFCIEAPLAGGQRSRFPLIQAAVQRPGLNYQSKSWMSRQGWIAFFVGTTVSYACHITAVLHQLLDSTDPVPKLWEGWTLVWLAVFSVMAGCARSAGGWQRGLAYTAGALAGAAVYAIIVQPVAIVAGTHLYPHRHIAASAVV